MSGASSRRKGHRYEVRTAKVLSDLTGLDIRTTRSLGASYGADVATVTGYDAHDRPVTHVPEVLGWSVECKNWSVREPGTWLRQAAQQAAPGLTPVVLWNRQNHAYEAGSAFVYDVRATYGWRETSIGEWLTLLVPEPHGHDDPPDEQYEQAAAGGHGRGEHQASGTA